MRIFKLFCILFAAFTIGAFSSCSEDIDTSNRYTFVGETMGDFLLNREEAHNQMFRDAFNQVQNSGSNQDFGTTKAAKMYFSLSDPGPNAFAGKNVKSVSFSE